MKRAARIFAALLAAAAVGVAAGYHAGFEAGEVAGAVRVMSRSVRYVMERCTGDMASGEGAPL